MTIEISISGHAFGPMWMPCCTALIKLSGNLNDLEDRFGDRLTLREFVMHVLHDGTRDLQHAKFTADSAIVVTSWQHSSTSTTRAVCTRTREWPLTAFPSVADMVAQEVNTWDVEALQDAELA